MIESNRSAAAWGGDASRKAASIAVARSALAAGPPVFLAPVLILAKTGDEFPLSNVYCAGYGTAGPAQLEARSGVPVWLLMTICGTLSACEYMATDGTHRIAPAAESAPLDALEAIPVGADPVAVARSYLAELLGRFAGPRSDLGGGLNAEQQALVGEIASLHRAAGVPSADFRALRRAAVAMSDRATGDVERTFLEFVASVSWPAASLTEELPGLLRFLHRSLRSYLSPERPTADEQAITDALSALYQAAYDRKENEPDADLDRLLENVRATPEHARANTPEFLARKEHYTRVGAESYAPFAVGLLLEAFRKA